MPHDTLKSANTLRKAGLPALQAEAVVEVMTDNLATKEDIENLSLVTQRDMKDLRRDMKDMDTSFRSDMKDLRRDMANGFNTLLQEMEKTNIYRDGQYSLLKWMSALNSGGVVIGVGVLIAIGLRIIFQ